MSTSATAAVRRMVFERGDSENPEVTKNFLELLRKTKADYTRYQSDFEGAKFIVEIKLLHLELTKEQHRLGAEYAWKN